MFPNLIVIVVILMLKRKTPGPASPVQEKQKGKKMTTWDEGEKGPLDYSSKNSDPNDSSKVEDLSMNQYVNVRIMNDFSLTEKTFIFYFNFKIKKNALNTFRGDLKPIEIEDNYPESDEELQSGSKSVASKKAANSNGKNSSTVKIEKKQTTTQSTGGLFSSFKSLVGSKTLTKESIEPVMEKMQEHLISKNVAAEIAQKVCENVAQNLEGKQLGSFQFVTSIVKQALNDSMVQILTPKKRVDILRDVYEAQRQKRPYVIVFCGVNGVGKSTNLAKVTFWLIENSFRVLIAACDTFRSGAVEQLRTHTRHLNALHPAENHNGKQMVELFEKGYGKDPAAIAHDAISYARDSKIDVVLVDTAGRMQDNQPLMVSLAKVIIS